ncbi:MAG: SBBP repeat-containing protein, partial [Acidimicrobiia bacterium]|nr:SBBP repeat-containing protein [Acidimicrobiia bacterium]
MALSPWHPLANSPLRRAITLMAAFTIAMSSLAFVIGSAEALGTPVAGRVLSDAAEPIAGVEVWLFEDSGNGQPGPEDHAVDGPALTREDGTYELLRPDPDVPGWVMVVLDAEVRVTDDVVCLPSAGGLFPGEHPGCVAVVPLEPGAVEAAPVVLTVEPDNVDAESGDENAEEVIGAAGEGVTEESQDPDEPEVVEAPATDASDLDRETLSQKVLEIPLGFEASLGRTDDHIAFVASSLGYGVDLGADGRASVVVSEEDYFTIDIIGASEPTAVVPSGEQDGVSNYFIGNDPDRWVTDVKRYGKVTFEGIYPGIDVVYHGNGRLLEYDFVVAPGFDPDQITFAIADAKSEITPDGTIRVDLQSGTALIVRAPIAYQETAAGRVDVDVVFSEAGPGAYAFSVGDYDVELPLVIDPVVDWATYLEAVNLARFEEIVVDGAGNVFVAGDSSGGSYPISGGAPDTTSVAQEAIVTKLNPTATAIIWSTYLGGDASDAAESLDIASDGSVYVAGQTWSSNFPMIGGGYDTTFDGGSEAFIVRLNSTGTAILSETFLGGTNTSFSDDEINDLMLDGSDRVYVVGHTRDNDFPTTGGVFQGGYGGGMYDAFVSRLDPTLASLQLSTFAGGSGIDLFETMELTSTGVVFAAGGGGSTDFPITPATAYQTTNPSGQSGKIIAINPTFTSVLYGSYLGGTGTDRLFGSAMVSDTEFVVVGDASSQDVPTRNAYQPGPGDGSSFTDDGIIAKIDITGSGPTSAPFVTYLGGVSDDQIYDVDLAPDGSLVFVGVTDSFGLPTTPDAIQASHQGVDDILVGAMSSDGSSLDSLSYYGGISSDRGFAVFVDGSGNIYLAGETSSSGLATPGVVDTSQDATSRSGFVAKLLPTAFDVTLLADTGGAGPGEDLVTQADTNNADPASNESDVGTGTGTTTLRGMDFHPVTEVLYAAGADTFGTINQSTGAFTSIGTFGSGDGSSGVRTFDNIQ